jgi:stage II sporulation protein D
MFYGHLITRDNDDNEVLYLFIDNNFEFSKEFENKNEESRKENLITHIKNYLKNRKIKFNGKKIFLVISGIVIGTITLGGFKKTNLDLNIKPKTEYVVSLDKFNEIEIPSKSNVEITIPSIEEEITKKNDVTPQQYIVRPNIKQPATSTNPIPNKSDTPTPIPDTTPTPASPVVEEPQLVNPVNVHMMDGTIQTVSFEDFIVGVVAAEMPASFHAEALKAQAVATRTYYLKALSQGKKITQINSGQITYKTSNDLKLLWGTNFDTYYNKIKNAVYSTAKEYIAYNGNYIEAVYCSTNNGKTASSLDVWGNYYPYLISVDSPWDISASSYLREIDKDLSVVISILGIPIDENTPIQVIDRTDNNSIRNISIGGVTFTGLYLRTALGLRSTDFDLSINNGVMHITTRGYGHGVGMSQYGANGMANAGNNYIQILSHYYPGTIIQK